MSIEHIERNGVVGAGGGGFPTAVKLQTKASIFLVNAAVHGRPILVDGADSGQVTPASLQLPVGTHRIEVEGFRRRRWGIGLGPRDRARSDQAQESAENRGGCRGGSSRRLKS